MRIAPTVLLAALVSTACFALAKTPGEVSVGGTLPETSMRGLSGASAKLSEFRGKPLIINVWASWCGPCRKEMASLDRLSSRDGGRTFAVIGISTDDYPNAAALFLKQSNTKFRQFIDQQLVLENMLGADRLPLTLLIDANGRVLQKVYGVRDWDDPAVVALIGKTFRLKINRRNEN
jgi:thiol-disulfide isomerase/thioredoxin